MIDFLDYLNSMLIADDGGTSAGITTDSLHDFVQQHFDFNILDADIVKSVQDASSFFNMDCPASIYESWTTGVCTQMADTAADDIMLINKTQMANLGITDVQAFDLVMTHEGAHRALQGIETGYTDHQEELCCDTMAGVRAALNEMPEDAVVAMKNSLADTIASDTHPAGNLRVEAIEDGYKFAKDYYEEHHCAPTFSECLEHFNEVHHIGEAHELVTLRPEDAPEAVKSYSKEEIDAHIHKAQREMDYQRSQVEYHTRMASHDMWRESELAHAKAAQRKLDAATRDYNHWRHETPNTEVKGYSTNDIEWLEKQVRISSSSEQAHWLDKLNWAKSHVQGYADNETLNHSLDISFEGSSKYDDDHYNKKMAEAALDRGDISNAKKHIGRIHGFTELGHHLPPEYGLDDKLPIGIRY